MKVRRIRKLHRKTKQLSVSAPSPGYKFASYLLWWVWTVPGVTFADVHVEGLKGPLLENVLAHLSLDDAPCDASALELQRLLRKGRGEVQAALEALGYYRAAIRIRLLEPTDCWQASLSVDPGEPLRVRSLNIELQGEGKADPGFESLIRASPLQVSQPFRSDWYENLKHNLREYASRNGYADADFLRHEVTVYPALDAADIELQFDSGQRYHFGAVRFQQDVLKPSLVERYLPFQPGEPYSSGKLAELYQALSGSGYFQSIQVQPLLAKRDDGEIPILVTLEPGLRELYSTGVGYSTNSGVRLRAGYSNRRINRKGHQWSVNLLLSELVSELSTEYRLPLGDPRKEWLSVDGGVKHENTDTSSSDAYQLGLRQIHQRAHGWQESRFLDLLREDYRIAGEDSVSSLVIPGISWSRTRADKPLHPNKGLALYAEIRGSTNLIGSDSNFIRVEARAKWIYRVLPSSRILLRGEIGASRSGRFSELPPSLRFFAGGDSSIRGYDYESLGPTDDEGKIIGGNGKLVSSIEWEQKITPQWSVAAFLDGGNAFDDWHFNWKSGAGIGVRWQSPLGPIRVDLARPLDDKEGSMRLHVTFGPDL